MYADLYVHVGFRMEDKGHVDKVASLQGSHAKEPGGHVCKWKVGQSSIQQQAHLEFRLQSGSYRPVSAKCFTFKSHNSEVNCMIILISFLWL